jgi:hypothetical protein
MFITVMAAALIVRVVYEIISRINVGRIARIRRTMYVTGLFTNNYIDSKVLFVTRFRVLANISFIRETDATRAYALVMENFAGEVVETYQYSYFDYAENQALFTMTILVLKNRRMIEIGHDYVEVLFSADQYSWANGLLKDLANCRVAERTTVMGFVRAETVSEN